MYIHGGGWTTGDRYEYVNLYEYLVNDGYLVVSIEYPLSDKETHLWDRQEQFIAQSLVWLKNHIAEYGGDIDRLALTGTSAGGNLAINIATRTNDGTFASILGETLPQMKSVAVVLPAVDPALLWNKDDPLILEAYREMAIKHFGGSPEEYPERYDMINSLKTINESTPPLLLAYAGSDHLVVPESYDPLSEIAEEKGITTKIVKLPFGDHTGTNGNTMHDQIFKGLTSKWFAKYLAE